MRDLNLTAEDRRRVTIALRNEAGRCDELGFFAEARAARSIADEMAPFACAGECGIGVLFEGSDCGKVSCQMNRLSKMEAHGEAEALADMINAEVL